MDDSNQSQNAPNDEINRFRVLIRVRPFLEEESQAPKKVRTQCIQFYSDNQTLSLIRPNYDQKDFYFDSVLDHEADQDTAYEQIAEPVVQDVLTGFNGVIMAYGQTGSGKTHTIFGSKNSMDALYSKKGADELHYECGIVPRCVNHIFEYIKENPNKAQFRITVSFLEIYMEQITDLLLQQSTTNSSSQFTPQGQNHNRQASSYSPIRQGGANSTTSLGSNLKLREDPKTGIFVDGLTQINVKSKEQLHQLIKIGAKRRSVNQTAMNKNSSRSHAVLQIFVEQRWVETSQEASDDNGPSRNVDPSGDQQAQVKKRHHRKALLTIVDLAGSERLSKTGSEGTRLLEAKNINKSIAALSNCISALASEKSLNHVPFRDSKLTRLLTESLGGNSKTTICACIGPSLANYEESYSTLLFATRAMSVRTFVKMNEKVEYKVLDEQGRQITTKNTPGEKVLRQKNSELIEQTEGLKQEIQFLKDQLQKHQSIVSDFSKNGTPNGGLNLNTYNSNNGNNMSMDMAAAQGNMQSFPNQIAKFSRNQYMMNHHSQHIQRSASPQPTNLGNQFNQVLMQHQFSNQQNEFIAGGSTGPYFNGSTSPQKPILLNQITPQGSQSFQLDGQGGQPFVNQSQSLMNLKQSQQLYQQQQKDSQMVLKLSNVIDNLQDELMSKSVQLMQLQDENLKLRQIQQLQSGNPITSQNVNAAIEGILNNPALRQVLFDKLAKQSFAQ